MQASTSASSGRQPLDPRHALLVPRETSPASPRHTRPDPPGNSSPHHCPVASGRVRCWGHLVASALVVEHPGSPRLASSGGHPVRSAVGLRPRSTWNTRCPPARGRTRSPHAVPRWEWGNVSLGPVRASASSVSVPGTLRILRPPLRSHHVKHRRRLRRTRTDGARVEPPRRRRTSAASSWRPRPCASAQTSDSARVRQRAHRST